MEWGKMAKEKVEGSGKKFGEWENVRHEGLTGIYPIG
jgi:hypothetical protein